jgi:cysteine desulfurase family protein (TIGR01976 family)
MNEVFREQFPALQRKHNGKPLIFFDGPAGVQVPQSVIDAISNYYKNSNANTHGAFVTSLETDEMMEATRAAASDFLGAEGPHTISFGQNMTSLNFSLAHAIGRSLQPGDEILITQLDHEANRGPWLTLRERGIIVREVKMRMDGTLNYEDLKAKLNDRTRLVAMGYAANLCGTVNDLHKVRQMTHLAGAWLLIDAVHFAPHFPIDVQDIGCDFLLCSAYKFYGPHVGILYSKPGLLDRLQPDRLRTAYQHAPYSIETGTLNHAAIAGVNAAIHFLASVGTGNTLREQITDGMSRIHRHEADLATSLYCGVKEIKGVEIIGPKIDAPLRAPTLALVVDGKTPGEVCKRLAEKNICAWDGHFYAVRAVEMLGLLEKGGVTRLGISAYTLESEVETVINAFKEIAAA